MVNETKINIRGVLGSKTAFPQGGSMRMILPKTIVRKYKKREIDLDETPFVFLDTDRGVLMVPLPDFVKDPDMRGLYYASPVGLSLKELANLIDELAEKDEL